MSKTLTSMERSAALIMSLDEDSAAEVFKFLSAQEIQQLSATMTNMPQVTQEQMAKTLEEFHADSEQFSAVNLLSTDHIRSVLVKALVRSVPARCSKTSTRVPARTMASRR